MTSKNERIYQVTRIVSSVVATLADYAMSEVPIEFSEFWDSIGLLDIAVDALISVNGGRN